MHSPKNVERSQKSIYLTSRMQSHSACFVSCSVAPSFCHVPTEAQPATTTTRKIKSDTLILAPFRSISITGRSTLAYITPSGVSGWRPRWRLRSHRREVTHLIESPLHWMPDASWCPRIEAVGRDSSMGAVIPLFNTPMSSNAAAQAHGIVVASDRWFASSASEKTG